MKEKGSLKDRIHFWQYQKRIQKEKKKRQEQEQWNQFINMKKQSGIYIQPTTKKYNFIQAFFHFLFGLFLGLLEPKKKEDTQSSSKLLQEIVELQREIEQNKDSNSFYYEKLKQKENLIQQFVKKENLSKTDEITVKECIQRVDSIKKQLQIDTQEVWEQNDLKTFNSLETKELENLKTKSSSDMQIQESNKNPINLEHKKDVDVATTPNSPIPVIKEEKKIKFVPMLDSSVKKIKEKQTEIIESQEDKQQSTDLPKQDKYQRYLINANKKLKKQSEELKKVKEEAKQVKTPAELYKLESSILWIQNQLILMEKEYEEISKDKDFQYLKDKYEYYQLDTKDLLKNNQAIQSLLEACQKEIDRMEKLAKQSPKEIKKLQKQDQKQEKKEKKEKSIPFYLDVEDFTLLRSQIMMDLNRQIEEIKEIKLTSIGKSTGFFQKARKLISNTMLVLTPMVFFKNKLTGMLTSSILVHNRVRSMRQIIDSKEAIYETGETLFQEIQSKQDCLYTIYYHLNASLAELKQLKQDFITKYQDLYPIEVETILTQLDILENQIIEKNNSLQLKQQKLAKVKQKIIQK